MNDTTAGSSGPGSGTTSSAAPSAPLQAASSAAPSSPRRYARFLIPIAAFMLLAVVLAVGIKHSRDVGVIHSPLIGKPAPAWNLPLLEDTRRTIGSQDLRGRWYVLNVWGTWCYACRDEHPALLAIAQHAGVPIIGIDWKDDDAQARSWLAQLGDPYSTVATDHDGHVVIDWGVYGAPETFLVNPAGIVVFKQIGPMSADVWQKQFASRLPSRHS